MRARDSILRLLALGRDLLPAALLAASLAVVAALAALAVPLAGRSLVDRLHGASDPVGLGRVFAVLVGLWLLAAAASLARDLAVASCGHRAVALLRARLVAHVLELPIARFDRARAAEFLSRLTIDVESLRRTVAQDALLAVGDVALVLGAAGLLLWLDPRLTAVLLCVSLLLPIVHRVLQPRLRRLNRRAQDGAAGAVMLVSEAFANIRLVRALGRESHEAGRAADALGQSARASIRADRVQAVAWRAAYTVLGMLGIGVLWYLAQRMRLGAVSLGTAAAYLYTLAVAAAPVLSLAGVAGRAQRAAVAADRIVEALDEPVEPRDPPGAMELVVRSGAVEFEEVGFAYPGGSPVLAGFSLLLPAGRTTALVGATGAGKSTVAALLQRFYEPDAGRVCIDGLPLAQATRRSVRAALAVVTQETLLFDASIRDNIRYGRLDATAVEVERAAAAAHVPEFADRWPHGLDTVVGERGVRLSGGQRQRIAIARALLRAAPILILDEATSSLDVESEQLVREATRALTKGRTTLVIAHRLDTVRDADQIAVLDGGRVIATGRHEELAAHCDRYRELLGRGAAGFDPPCASP